MIKSNLIIESVDEFDQRTIEEVQADKIENEFEIKYQYRNEFGECSISIFKESVEIIRKGEIESYQILKKGETTDFTYKTPYIEKHFQIYTYELAYIEKQLTTRYAIYDNGIKINSLKIKIEEKNN